MSQLLCLLTHDSKAHCTLLTPLLNEEAAIEEADGAVTLAVGDFSYRLVCLLAMVVPQQGDTPNAQTAALFAQADLMLSDSAREAIVLYQFHDDLLQLSGCQPMSEAERAELRRSGVFVRSYPPEEGDGDAPVQIMLTFPLGTLVQAGEAPAGQDAADAPSSALMALTPGPAPLEVRFSAEAVPTAGVISYAPPRQCR